MSESNLFSSLEKFRPRGNRNPKEDFFTECFKFILENDGKVRKEFIKLLFDNKHKGCPQGKPISIKTQQQISGGGRPDMKITMGNKIIWVENKIESTQGREKTNSGKEIKQLDNYLKSGDYVAYITLYSENIGSGIEGDDNFLGHFYWHQIYKIVEKYKENDRIIIDFLKYMGDKKMKLPEKILEENLPTWRPFALFHVKMEYLLDRLKDSITKEKILDVKKRQVGDNGYDEGSHNWCGFYFDKTISKQGKEKNLEFFAGFNTYQDKLGFSVEFKIPTTQL